MHIVHIWCTNVNIEYCNYACILLEIRIVTHLFILRSRSRYTYNRNIVERIVNFDFDFDFDFD